VSEPATVSEPAAPASGTGNVVEAVRHMRTVTDGIAWVAGPHGGHYSLQPAGDVQVLRPLVGAEIVTVQANECLVVIRTLPGAAGTVAEFIDFQRNPEILGTVAGDNTVLVIPRTVKKTRSLEHSLKHKLIEGR